MKKANKKHYRYGEDVGQFYIRLTIGVYHEIVNFGHFWRTMY